MAIKYEVKKVDHSVSFTLWQGLHKVLLRNEQLSKNLIKEENKDIDLETPASGKAKHKNLNCNYCHKKGHFKADCLKLKDRKQHEEGSTNTVVGFDSAEGGVLKISIGAHVFAKAMRLRRSDIYVLQGPSAITAVQETFGFTKFLLGCVEETDYGSPSVVQGTMVLAGNRETFGIHLKSPLIGTTVMILNGTSKIGEFLPLQKSKICLGLFDIVNI